VLLLVVVVVVFGLFSLLIFSTVLKKKNRTEKISQTVRLRR